MRSALVGRLSKLEAALPSGQPSIAVLPHDAGEYGPEHLAEAIERTRVAHRARTGRSPTILIQTGVPRSEGWGT